VEISMLNNTGHESTQNGAKYPDAIRFRMPRGLRDLVKEAAQAESVPASEFIRRAIGERIERLADNGNGGSLSFGAGA
jgi:hypothetical protein